MGHMKAIEDRLEQQSKALADPKKDSSNLENFDSGSFRSQGRGYGRGSYREGRVRVIKLITPKLTTPTDVTGVVIPEVVIKMVPTSVAHTAMAVLPEVIKTNFFLNGWANGGS